jgi:hypothetical protein
MVPNKQHIIISSTPLDPDPPSWTGNLFKESGKIKSFIEKTCRYQQFQKPGIGIFVWELVHSLAETMVHMVQSL